MSLPQHLQLSSTTIMNSSVATNPYLIDQLQFMQHQERQSYYQATDYLAPTSEECTPKLTPADRRTMCSWSYQIVDACSIDREIAVIAMSYCDRFMGTSSERAKSALDSRREFQLAFITCLIIALKSRGGLQVDSDFVSDIICRGMYGPNEIIDMEREVLSALAWRLNGPSPHEFIRGFMEFLPQFVAHKNVKAIAYDQVEKVMLDYETAIDVCPSSIAFAAIMAAMSNIDSSVLHPSERLAWMQTISTAMDSKAENCFDSPVEQGSGLPELSSQEHGVLNCPTSPIRECKSSSCLPRKETKGYHYSSAVSVNSSFTSSTTSLSDSERSEDDSTWDLPNSYII